MTEPSYPGQPQPPAPGPNPYADQPYAGQPYPGQAPAPGQPYAGQPYAGPGYGAMPPAPPKKSNTGRIVLIIVGALVLLLIAGAVVAYLALRGTIKDVTDATSIRVVAPETLNGRPRSTEPDLVKAAGDTEGELKRAAPNATSTVGAFYGTGERKDLALIVAVSDISVSPAQTLEGVIKGVSGQLPLQDLADVDPGPLGGVAKCGSGTTSGIDLGVCVWADRGSSGQFYLYFSSAQDAAKELASVRAVVEQKS